MKCRLTAAVVLLLAMVASLRAESPRTLKKESSDHNISLGQLTPTPEMWFYDQEMREHSDPKAAVRRKAEFDTAQRQRRLAAQAWYGISNSRPTVFPTPHAGGSYSPTWTSNTRDSQRWAGATAMPSVVLVPVPSAAR